MALHAAHVTPKFFRRPSNRRGGSVRLLPSFIFPLRGKGGASCCGASLGVWALRRKAREGSVVRLTRVATNGLVDDTGFDGEQVGDWSIRKEGLSIADKMTMGTDTVTSLSCITRFIMCDCDVEELTKCCTFIMKHGHSARNNMRCNNEILCTGCTKCDAHGAHVVHQHLSASLVYTLQCHSYTTSNVTNILSSMSLIYSILCQGYTRSCLRGILTSTYEVFSSLCKGDPEKEWKNERMREWNLVNPCSKKIICR